LWTDKNLEGFSLKLEPAESRQNLLEVDVWPWLDDFSDKFPSYSSTSGLCLGFEHIHFQGSFRWLGPTTEPTYDLADTGWNDRISSVVNGG
jgi:hypothetical protein